MYVNVATCLCCTKKFRSFVSPYVCLKSLNSGRKKNYRASMFEFHSNLIFCLIYSLMNKIKCLVITRSFLSQFILFNAEKSIFSFFASSISSWNEKHRWKEITLVDCCNFWNSFYLPWSWFFFFMWSQLYVSPYTELFTQLQAELCRRYNFSVSAYVILT